MQTRYSDEKAVCLSNAWIVKLALTMTGYDKNVADSHFAF